MAKRQDSSVTLSHEEREALYEFKGPAELLPFHIIVKVPGRDSDVGLMSHVFVFAEDRGSAVNAVVAAMADQDAFGGINPKAQFTCQIATDLGGGVYEM